MRCDVCVRIHANMLECMHTLSGTWKLSGRFRYIRRSRSRSVAILAQGCLGSNVWALPTRRICSVGQSFMAKLGGVPVDVEQLEKVIRGTVEQCLGRAGGPSGGFGLVGPVNQAKRAVTSKAQKGVDTWSCDCGFPGSTNSWIPRTRRRVCGALALPKKGRWMWERALSPKRGPPARRMPSAPRPNNQAEKLRQHPDVCKLVKKCLSTLMGGIQNSCRGRLDTQL